MSAYCIKPLFFVSLTIRFILSNSILIYYAGCFRIIYYFLSFFIASEWGIRRRLLLIRFSSKKYNEKSLQYIFCFAHKSYLHNCILQHMLEAPVCFIFFFILCFIFHRNDVSDVSANSFHLKLLFFLRKTRCILFFSFDIANIMNS